MAIKQNVGKLNEQKRDVKATFAECKAENPLECKYHGTKALEDLIAPVLKDGFEIKSGKGEYDVTAVGQDWPYMEHFLNKALKGTGFKAKTYSQSLDNTVSFAITKEDDYTKQFVFVTPEDEVDLSYDAEKAPTNGEDVVEDPDKPAVKNRSKSGVSIDQIKDFLIKDGYLAEDVNGWDDSSFKSWYDLIDNGVGPDGGNLSDSNKDIMKEMAAHVGLDHPVSKAIAKMMEEKYGEKIEGNGEEKSEEEGVADDGEITADEILEYINGGVSEDIAKGYIKEVTEGKSYLTGKDLDEIDIAFWNDQAKKKPDHKVAKAWMETLAKLQGEDAKNEEKKGDNGNAKSEDDEDITEEDMKEYLKGTWAEDMAKEYISEVKEGKKSLSMGGCELNPFDINFWNNLAQNKPDHKVAKIWAKTKAKINGTTGEAGSNEKEEVKHNDNEESVDASEFDDDILDEMTASGEIESDFAEELDEFADMLEDENTDEPKDDELTTDDIKDFFKKCGIKKGVLLSDDNLTATKEALETGKWKGKALTSKNKQWYKALADKAPDHKVAKAISEMISGDDKFKPKKNKVTQAQKDALTGKKKDAVIGQTSPSVAEMSDDLLKPLEHDETKFPANLTKEALDEAISNGQKAGGHGGLNTTIVTIDGKKYICKNGYGHKGKIVKNGYDADMGYRAGGIYAPDAKLYEFGDGKVYKLSEFIEGKRLIDEWKDATPEKREEIRKELLKGYPLDVLFSNYDVLGTSPEDSQKVEVEDADGKTHSTYVAFNNVILGDDGHAYRIDNDWAFFYSGTGGKKSSHGASFSGKVSYEEWDDWKDREWIDDFRTMRKNEKNAGMFDRYSTADIFTAAGNINLDNVTSVLPEDVQKALKKPLFEMKQMAWRAVNISLGGYKNDKFVSIALDSSYEASKRGLREQCQLPVSWNNSGFGKYKSHWGNYQPKPFLETPPEEPKDPTTALDNKLDNSEYTGKKIASIIFSAAKTINYHGGEQKTDANGNKIGSPMSTPDYKPNASKIAEFEKIDREKLEELAKTDDDAKALLGFYDMITYSKENGWKKPIGLVPNDLEIKGELSQGYQSPTEKKIMDDLQGAIAEYQDKMEAYKKKLSEYEERKNRHNSREAEKAKRAGGSIHHNFHDFAKAFMEEGIGTDGIAHEVETNGIAPIESSMASQKGSSYGGDAVKWKVREMMALGYTPEQIMEMAEKGDLYNGSYYKHTIEKHLIPDKDSWERDMNSQAMYLGLNMVKMENETSDLYDKVSGVIYLNRNIGDVPKGITEAEKKLYTSSSKTGWIGPHVDSAADCMQFEKNDWNEPYKQVYAVPVSRIVCCANNNKASGGDYGWVSEQEYVGNLFQLPCWVYHKSNQLSWKGAIDKAKETEGMKEMLKRFASRLAAFSTFKK